MLRADANAPTEAAAAAARPQELHIEAPGWFEEQPGSDATRVPCMVFLAATVHGTSELPVAAASTGIRKVIEAILQ